MPKTKPCAWCGKPIPVDGKRKYHPACAALAKRAHSAVSAAAKRSGKPTVCLRCGKTFLSVHIRHFCPECNLKP